MDKALAGIELKWISVIWYSTSSGFKEAPSIKGMKVRQIYPDIAAH
jgi:hypothetical protein